MHPSHVFAWVVTTFAGLANAAEPLPAMHIDDFSATGAFGSQQGKVQFKVNYDDGKSQFTCQKMPFAHGHRNGSFPYVEGPTPCSDPRFDFELLPENGKQQDALLQFRCYVDREHHYFLRSHMIEGHDIVNEVDRRTNLSRQHPDQASRTP
ncbi:hypothetical protein JX265_013137 [Neoarthrinium moseri]|uniref:Uncharacterized protein n=1 Tax=Neoarthrinium moseri TaxID=1658444 RepID=A0A9P9W919_9PEZI|nr:hypothetical protein JX265_013137 [Neoarthrinium moseri]